jgi:hypothetical protein
VTKADGLAIKLSKVYDDRNAAGQTGVWSTLLYEGVGSPGGLSGEWAFYGLETSQ